MQPNTSADEARPALERAPPVRSKAVRIAEWIVSILLTALFAFASFPKLTQAPQAVEGFQKAGYAGWFLLFIGAAELAGAIGLLIPKLRFLAAAGLSIIMTGAVVTHLRSGDDIGHTAPAAVALLLLLWLAWSTRPAGLLKRA